MAVACAVPVSTTRLVSIAAVTAAVLSVVTLMLVTWIVVNPGFWFPGAYAERGPAGVKGPPGDKGPQGEAGPPGSPEGVEELESEVDEVRSEVEDVRSGVEDAEARVSDLESEEHADPDRFSELEDRLEDACSHVLEVRGWGC